MKKLCINLILITLLSQSCKPTDDIVNSILVGSWNLVSIKGINDADFKLIDIKTTRNIQFNSNKSVFTKYYPMFFGQACNPVESYSLNKDIISLNYADQFNCVHAFAPIVYYELKIIELSEEYLILEYGGSQNKFKRE